MTGDVGRRARTAASQLTKPRGGVGHVTRGLASDPGRLSAGSLAPEPAGFQVIRELFKQDFFVQDANEACSVVYLRLPLNTVLICCRFY